MAQPRERDRYRRIVDDLWGPDEDEDDPYARVLSEVYDKPRPRITAGPITSAPDRVSPKKEDPPKSRPARRWDSARDRAARDDAEAGTLTPARKTRTPTPERLTPTDPVAYSQPLPISDEERREFDVVGKQTLAPVSVSAKRKVSPRATAKAREEAIAADPDFRPETFEPKTVAREVARLTRGAPRAAANLIAPSYGDALARLAGEAGEETKDYDLEELGNLEAKHRELVANPSTPPWQRARSQALVDNIPKFRQAAETADNPAAKAVTQFGLGLPYAAERRVLADAQSVLGEQLELAGERDVPLTRKPGMKDFAAELGGFAAGQALYGIPFRGRVGRALERVAADDATNAFTRAFAGQTASALRPLATPRTGTLAERSAVRLKRGVIEGQVQGAVTDFNREVTEGRNPLPAVTRGVALGAAIGGPLEVAGGAAVDVGRRALASGAGRSATDALSRTFAAATAPLTRLGDRYTAHLEELNRRAMADLAARESSQPIPEPPRDGSSPSVVGEAIPGPLASTREPPPATRAEQLAAAKGSVESRIADLRARAGAVGESSLPAAAAVATDDEDPDSRWGALAAAGTLALGSGDVPLYSRLYRTIETLPKKWDQPQHAKTWLEYLGKSGMPFKRAEFEAIRPQLKAAADMGLHYSRRQLLSAFGQDLPHVAVRRGTEAERDLPATAVGRRADVRALTRPDADNPAWTEEVLTRWREQEAETGLDELSRSEEEILVDGLRRRLPDEQMLAAEEGPSPIRARYLANDIAIDIWNDRHRDVLRRWEDAQEDSRREFIRLEEALGELGLSTTRIHRVIDLARDEGAEYGQPLLWESVPRGRGRDARYVGLREPLFDEIDASPRVPDDVERQWDETQALVRRGDWVGPPNRYFGTRERERGNWDVGGVDVLPNYRLEWDAENETIRIVRPDGELVWEVTPRFDDDWHPVADWQPMVDEWRNADVREEVDDALWEAAREDGWEFDYETALRDVEQRVDDYNSSQYEYGEAESAHSYYFESGDAEGFGELEEAIEQLVTPYLARPAAQAPAEEVVALGSGTATIAPREFKALPADTRAKWARIQWVPGGQRYRELVINWENRVGGTPWESRSDISGHFRERDDYVAHLRLDNRTYFPDESAKEVALRASHADLMARTEAARSRAAGLLAELETYPQNPDQLTPDQRARATDLAREWREADAEQLRLGDELNVAREALQPPQAGERVTAIQEIQSDLQKAIQLARPGDAPAGTPWDAPEDTWGLSVAVALREAVSEDSDRLAWSTADNRVKWANLGRTKAKLVYDDLVPSAVRRLLKAFGEPPAPEQITMQGERWWSVPLSDELKEKIRVAGLPMLSALAMPLERDREVEDDGWRTAVTGLGAVGAIQLARRGRMRLPLRQVAEAFGTAVKQRGMNAAALGAVAAGLQQIPDEDWQATGEGVAMLALLHVAAAPGVRGAVRGSVRNAVREAAKTSPRARQVARWFSPHAILDDAVVDAIEVAQKTEARWNARLGELAAKSRARGGDVDRAIGELRDTETNAEFPRLSPDDQHYALQVAGELAQEIQQLTDASIGTGVLLESAALPNYLKRKYAYWESIAAGADAPGGGGTRLSPQHARTLGTSPTDMAERARLGEVREASYRLEAMREGGRNVAMATLFTTLRGLPDAIEPSYGRGFDELELARGFRDAAPADTRPFAAQVVEELEESLSKQRDTYRRGNRGYITLPDVPAYGALRGAVVRREVFDYLRGWDDDGWYDAALRFWRRAKTVYNPGTHLANVVSNVVMSHVAGVPWWKLGGARRALEEYRAGSAAPDNPARALAERGIIDAAARAEGVLRGDRPSKRGLRKLAKTTRPETRAVLEESGVVPKTAAGKRVTAVTDKLGELNERAVQLYADEDNWFRVAAYQAKIDEGLDPDAAAKFAQDALINFQSSSPVVRMLRKTAVPFVVYPVNALPTLAAHIVDKPWRWIGLMATIGMIDQAGEWVAGDIPEEDLYPGQRRKAGGYLTPGNVQLPVSRGAEGEAYMLDLSRWFPTSALTSGAPPGTALGTVAEEVPGILQGSGPVQDLGTRLYANKDPFTGEPTFGAHRLPSENWQQFAKILWQTAAPSALGFQTERLATDVAKGDYPAARLDALGYVGLRPRVVRPGAAADDAEYDLERGERTIDQELNRRLRGATRPSWIAREEDRAQRRQDYLLERYRRRTEPAGAARP